MRKLALCLSIGIVGLVVVGAVVFVWAMQRDIDISSPEARAQLTVNMILGCRVRLPELMKQQADPQPAFSPEQAGAVCGCAVRQILSSRSSDGRINPGTIIEAEIDAVTLSCLREANAQQ
jgi:hypothetical protein